MQGSDARAELNRPENQKLMRQFMKSPEGEKNSAAFRANFERVFSEQKECPNGGVYSPGAFDVCRCEKCIEVENGED